MQTGDPRGIEPSDESAPTGYRVDGKTRNVPLEVFPVGAKAPVYGATFDEEGYGGAAATIPFQVRAGGQGWGQGEDGAGGREQASAESGRAGGRRERRRRTRPAPRAARACTLTRRASAARARTPQAYGALGMAREEYSADSASSQWFWLLFDSDLTPAGKNLLDGRYACFGYTIDGQDQLRAVKVGDVIKSAKLLSGGDKLVAGK